MMPAAAAAARTAAARLPVGAAEGFTSMRTGSSFWFAVSNFGCEDKGERSHQRCIDNKHLNHCKYLQAVLTREILTCDVSAFVLRPNKPARTCTAIGVFAGRPGVECGRADKGASDGIAGGRKGVSGSSLGTAFKLCNPSVCART